MTRSKIHKFELQRPRFINFSRASEEGRQLLPKAGTPIGRGDHGFNPSKTELFSLDFSYFPRLNITLIDYVMMN